MMRWMRARRSSSMVFLLVGRTISPGQIVLLERNIHPRERMRNPQISVRPCDTIEAARPRSSADRASASRVLRRSIDSVAQRTERCPPEAEVAGSNPTGVAFLESDLTITTVPAHLRRRLLLP